MKFLNSGLEKISDVESMVMKKQQFICLSSPSLMNIFIGSNVFPLREFHSTILNIPPGMYTKISLEVISDSKIVSEGTQSPCN